jgi:hypothetical protein
MLAVLAQNPTTQDSDADHHHCQHYCRTFQDLNTLSAESILACWQRVSALYDNAHACAGHTAPQVVGELLDCPVYSPVLPPVISMCLTMFED